jgi:hypothetical protein
MWRVRRVFVTMWAFEGRREGPVVGELFNVDPEARGWCLHDGIILGTL